jgi:hypothetical protein
MTIRNKIIKELELRLGGQIIDVELDPEHYHLSIDKALEKYRQRAENSVEERFVDLEIQIEQNVYQLDSNIIEVHDIYQRATGGIYNNGVEFEPFGAAYMNTHLGSMAGGNAGGSLATYEALAQRMELIGLMFGYEFQFTWHRTKHLLTIHRKPRAEMTVYLHAYAYREDDDLLTDYMSKPWIKDYAFAYSKLMLGEARSKFSTIAGPQGGTTLNGDQLKSDALVEMERLEEDLKNFRDGSAGLGIIIG